MSAVTETTQTACPSFPTGRRTGERGMFTAFEQNLGLSFNLLSVRNSGHTDSDSKTFSLLCSDSLL